MIIHIPAVERKPKTALNGISLPPILIFQPSLNGRSIAGFLIRNPMIEAWENMNARREPTAYSAPMFSKTPVLNSPGMSSAIAMQLKTRIATYGVLNLLWTLLAGAEPIREYPGKTPDGKCR